MKLIMPMIGSPRPSSRLWVSVPATPGQVALIAPGAPEQGTGLPAAGSAVAVLPVAVLPVAVPSVAVLPVAVPPFAAGPVLGDVDGSRDDKTADMTATYLTHDVRTAGTGAPPRGAPV